MADFARQRQVMVERQLLPSHTFNPLLLKAAAHLPREKFLPEELQALAYIDDDIKLDVCHFMLRPTDLLRMIDALELKSNDRVLDVACTTGYSTLMLNYLAQRVVGVEDLDRYIEMAHARAEEEEATNIKFVHGPYHLGYVDESPYDAILVQQGLEMEPEGLLDQLAVGGRLIYINQQSQQYGRAVLLQRHNDHYTKRIVFELTVPCFNKVQPRFSL